MPSRLLTCDGRAVAPEPESLKVRAWAVEHLTVASALEWVRPDLDVVGDDRLEQLVFDRLTRLSKQLLGAPVTMMSLTDPDEHFFKSEGDKSEIWATLRSAPLIYSFCRDATLGGPVVVNDCGADKLSAGRGLAQLGVVAYAAVPLRDVQGHCFGSFLTFDTVSRDWSEDDVQTFSEIAELVMTKFRLHRTVAIANARAAALTHSERRIRVVIETAPDAFVSIDAGGAVTEWNPAAQQMFGWSRDEVLGRNVAELIAPAVHGEDHEDGIRHYLSEVESEQRTVIETSATRRDGSELPIEISVTGLRADDGWAFHAFLHDISDRRRAERLTDEFLALVSHELRTPLSSIVAHVELLQDEDDDALPEGVRRRFLDVISRNAVRLERLVGDLLFVAQLDSSHLNLCMGPVDIGQIASEAVQAAAPRAAQQGLELVLEIGDAPTLTGDRDRLGQTFDNLITNAVNYSPDGGKVVVRVAGLGEQVVVEVQDQGVGIPAAEQEHIFRRFFRASTAVDLHVQGVGLGLLIVKTIVRGHGGEIGVSSAPGQGTTFRLQLPVAPSQ
jgi:PAS domain S-box-containing protein